MRKLVVFLAVIATSTLWILAGHATEMTSASSYKVLDESGIQLREHFNRGKGTVRLLFVVDPICLGCLRGLDDVNKDLLENTKDPRLQTFVVHVPVLSPPPKAKDVPPAAELLHNAHVRHYWNPSGALGRSLAEGVDLKQDGKLVYAWDVWLIYGPEATWDGELPPKPRRLMHQLRALQGSREFPRFDSVAFGREVHQLLSQLPSDTAAR
jgi:hypothetical protein